MRPCTNSQSYRCPPGERLLLFRIWKFFFDKAAIACASFNVALWFPTVAVLFRESKVSELRDGRHCESHMSNRNKL